MKITDLCEAERPREKMALKGPAALSNAELFAILLRVGTTKYSAIDISQLLMKSAEGSLVTLSSRRMEDYCAIPGIHRDKAVTIMAAFELGRRFMLESAVREDVFVTGPAKIYEMMLPLMKGLGHEECWIVMLNNAQKVIDKLKMTSGGSSSTVVDIKDIIRNLLYRGAQSVILVHNHPSGNPRPGSADMEQTAALKEAVCAVDIRLLDHIIVCDDCYYSFADECVARP